MHLLTLLLTTVAAANDHGGRLGIQQLPRRTSGRDGSNQHQQHHRGASLGAATSTDDVQMQVQADGADLLLPLPAAAAIAAVAPPLSPAAAAAATAAVPAAAIGTYESPHDDKMVQAYSNSAVPTILEGGDAVWSQDNASTGHSTGNMQASAIEVAGMQERGFSVAVVRKSRGADDESEPPNCASLTTKGKCIKGNGCTWAKKKCSAEKEAPAQDMCSGTSKKGLCTTMVGCKWEKGSCLLDQKAPECQDQAETSYHHKDTNEPYSCVDLAGAGGCTNGEHGGTIKHECPVSCGTCGDAAAADDDGDDYGYNYDIDDDDDDDDSAVKDAASKELAVKAAAWCNDPEAARQKYGAIEEWDVSDVTSFKELFSADDNFGGINSCSTFNADLNAWKTSRVVDMENMFFEAAAFNGNIALWDTSNVEDMIGMFYSAKSFNGNLDSWDTSNVEKMSFMFYGADAFNQDLGRWRFKLDPLPSGMTNMFKGASKSNCTFESPGFYDQTEDRITTARLYCNGPSMLKDGAECPPDTQCDTGSCSTSNTRCLGYAADVNCTVATNSGGCFVAPTTTQSWFTSTAASLKDYFPEQMVGSGNESRVISWNRLNGQPVFQSTDILTKGDGSTLHTRLTYKLQWLQQSANAAAFKVGQMPPSENSSDWDPNNGPGGVGIDCVSGDIFATPNITGTYTAWLIAVDTTGPAKRIGLPTEYDEVLIKQWKITVTKPTPFTINPESVNRSRTARPDVISESFVRKEAGTLYTVGETYSFAPITINASGIKGNKSDSNNNWNITYTLVNQPNGLLIDPADGFIQGVPRTEGTFTMKVYAIDGSGTRSANPIQNITFDVRNGPNKRPCSNNGYLVAPDKSHTSHYCNCEGTGFEGDNCETPKAIHTAVKAGASVVSMLLLLTIAYMYRARHLRWRGQIDALVRARKAYGLSKIEPTTRGGMSVNSGDLVGVTTNPSFVGIDAANPNDSDVVLLLDPAAGYNNDLLAYEDDPNGSPSAGIQDSLPSSPTTEKMGRRNQLSKFVAPTISLGKSTLAAKGLDVLLGIDPKTYMHVKQEQKVKVMLKEFAKNGTDEDNKNLKTLINGTYINPPNSDGSPLTPEEIIGQSRTIEELMEYSDVQDAGLERHHVLALRLYTTSSYSSINNPMRQSPPVLPHPFAATLYYISDALSKLREVQGKDPALRNASLVFWRGMKNLQITEEFIRTGGSEMACMSTTSSRQVAQDFALSKSPLLFKFMSKSFMSHGANIGFLSVYPGEKEVLYPPLTYLRPIKVSEETIGTTVYKVVEVEPVFPK